MKKYGKIFAYFGDYRKTVAVTFLLTLCQVIGTTALPYIMATIIDDGIKNQDVAYLLKMGALMLAVTAATCFFGVMAARKSGKAASGLGDNLRTAMMEKLCDFSSADVDYFTRASFINRMTGDVGSVQGIVGIMLSTLISAPLTVLAIIIISFRINRGLSLIFLIAVPFFSLASYIIVKIARPYFSKNAVNNDTVNRVLLEDLVSIRLVKAFVREDYMTGEYKKAAGDVKYYGLKAEQITNTNSPIQSLIVNLCVILLLWFGGQKIMAGNIQVGELFSLITYTNQLLYQITLISMMVVPMIGSIVSVDRVIEVLEKEPQISDDGADENLHVQDGSVVFDHVYFDYGENVEKNDMLLQDINLTIADKEAIGIVGATGSGKSTLVNLLPRLFDVKYGSVSIGGCRVNDLTFANLRREIAVAPQKSLLFSGTLGNNLRCGNPEASEEDMIKACKDASIYDFVTDHEEGFDCEIDEGGNNVSGGQRQRLSLARAFIKKSQLLVMDDCTSALDKATERAVIDHIVNDCTDRTRILISGKISSIKRMDRIVVLDRGRISGIGTHSELLESNAIYRDLCVSQGEV